MIWQKNLANGDVAVAMVNLALTTSVVSVNIGDLGLAIGNYQVREIWTGSELPVVNSQIAFQLSTQATAFVVVHRK